MSRKFCKILIWCIKMIKIDLIRSSRFKYLQFGCYKVHLDLAKSFTGLS